MSPAPPLPSHQCGHLLSTHPSPLVLHPSHLHLSCLLCSPIFPQGVGHRKLEFYALRTLLSSTVLEATAPEDKLWDIYHVNLQSSGALFPLPHPSLLLLCTSLSPPALYHRAQGEAESHLIFGFSFSPTKQHFHTQSATEARSTDVPSKDPLPRPLPDPCPPYPGTG